MRKKRGSRNLTIDKIRPKKKEKRIFKQNLPADLLERTMGVSGVEAREVPEAEAALMLERCRRAREWPPPLLLLPSRFRPLRPRWRLDWLCDDGWPLPPPLALAHGSPTERVTDGMGSPSSDVCMTENRDTWRTRTPDGAEETADGTGGRVEVLLVHRFACCSCVTWDNNCWAGSPWQVAPLLALAAAAATDRLLANSIADTAESGLAKDVAAPERTQEEEEEEGGGGIGGGNGL